MKSIFMFLVGFLLHIVFLLSIFDIYFKTPIVQGITSNPNPLPGAAKRLVFIVADGLRADSFYVNDRKSTPFLRNIIEKHGSWGVSHTRVPTESRPGVVALAAGIYEDPSAVFKGWKENPVEFDTLFNQSHHTWAWGSPDIVHMFKQNHVETLSYSPDDEDFSGKDSSWKLDKWVFDHVKILFEKSKWNPNLNNLLHKDKIVFFLHLLGLDTAGHTIKPLAMKYQENLQVVDQGIQDIQELIENFYHDGKTSYVFTADHGMTNWGSHGAGSRDETEVPLLAWGAGVQLPTHSDPRDPISPEEWQLSHLKRRDVKQADIVVLLASLIGCSIPVNSVGQLPHAYLDLPAENVAKLTFLNSKQLLAQADRKRELVQRGTLSWLYYSYPKLTPEDTEIKVAMIQQHIQSRDYSSAVKLSEELSDLSVQALHYYHNYYQSLLLKLVSLLFLGWIVLLFCKLSNYEMKKPSKYVNGTFITCAFIMIVLIQAQQLDWQFYFYCFLPLLLWWIVFSMMDSWMPLLRSRRKIYKVFVTSVILAFFTEIMVAAFFQRWVLSLGMLIISLWPLCETDKIKLISPSVLFLWLLSCALVGIFPLMPVIGSESNSALVITSAFFWGFLISVSIVYVSNSVGKVEIFKELCPLVGSMAVVYFTATSMDSGKGLPFFCQLTSWNLLFSPILALTYEDKTIPRRLIKLHATVLPPFILMSVRHEGFFLLALCFHLSCWLVLEAKMNGVGSTQIKKVEFPSPKMVENPQRPLTAEDFRRAALFVFYIFYSFFGTGNIASLNSFEVVWVRCFLSVFSPFTMMTLILVKMLIPFVLVSSIFRALSITIKAPTVSMFLAVLIICDLMGAHFLHLVTNEGSWLDIGTSISHFVIVQVTVLALVLIYGIASILTGTAIKPLKIALGLLGLDKDDYTRRRISRWFD